jgi:hypothetical protein
MYKFFLINLVLIQLITALAQVSHFDSQVSGISIGNTRIMNTDGSVLRGMEPRKALTELVDYGITDVIIFKNPTKNEVQDEIDLAKTLGVKTHHIPFRWKGLESAQKACEQVVEAVLLIQKLEDNGKKTFFHCTVGEDRTGFLAGIYRMTTQSWDADKAFKKEMCANGYAEGNPTKPGMVTGAIHKELTPLFDYMSEKIEAGETVNKKLCKGIKLVKSARRCK